MSESHFDEYEHYNFAYDKYIYTGHSGKMRSKKEVVEHTNHHDPNGHSRKIVTKLMNTERKRKESTGSNSGKESNGAVDTSSTSSGKEKPAKE